MRAHAGDSDEPFLMLRAVDSTDSDIVHAAVRAAYPTAVS
jgi:hypothetical protein